MVLHSQNGGGVFGSAVLAHDRDVPRLRAGSDYAASGSEFALLAEFGDPVCGEYLTVRAATFEAIGDGKPKLRVGELLVAVVGVTEIAHACAIQRGRVAVRPQVDAI
jgi:hypothetical protein